MVSNTRILFPVDFSNYPFAVPPALEELIDGPDIDVVLLHVLDGARPSVPKLARCVGELDILARRHFRHSRVRRRVDHGQPADRILDYIHRNEIGMAVMPARDSAGFGKGPLGRVASRVLAEASCPIWLEWRSATRASADPACPVPVCCAIEGAASDERIIREAAAIADRLGRELTIISPVTPFPDQYGALLRRALPAAPAAFRETDRIHVLRRVAPRSDVVVAAGWPEAVIARVLRDRRAGLLIAGDCRAAVIAAEPICPVLRLNNVEPEDAGYSRGHHPRECGKIA